MLFFACLASCLASFASIFEALGVALLFVLGFAEGAAAVLVTFVAPAADVTSGRSVWQPTDTTCLAKTLAYDGFPVTPSTILRASGKEIFRSVRIRWISFSVFHRGQSLE